MDFLKNFVEKIKTPWRKLGKNPAFDWHFALFCFAVGLFIVIIICIISFIKLSSAESEEELQITPVMQISKEKIEKAIRETEERDINAASIPEEILDDPSM